MWYRLALAWIPRYIVLITIFMVAITITMHVHIKYRRISHLEHGNWEGPWTSEGSKTAPGSIHRTDNSNYQQVGHALPATGSRPAILVSWQDSIRPSYIPRRSSIIRDFATTHALIRGEIRSPESQPISPTPTSFSRSHSYETETTDNTPRHSVSAQTSATDSTDELLAHRHAIEKQVHLLFIYPTSYAIMWLFHLFHSAFSSRESISDNSHCGFAS